MTNPFSYAAEELNSLLKKESFGMTAGLARHIIGRVNELNRLSSDSTAFIPVENSDLAEENYLEYKGIFPHVFAFLPSYLEVDISEDKVEFSTAFCDQLVGQDIVFNPLENTLADEDLAAAILQEYKVVEVSLKTSFRGGGGVIPNTAMYSTCTQELRELGFKHDNDFIHNADLDHEQGYSCKLLLERTTEGKFELVEPLVNSWINEEFKAGTYVKMDPIANPDFSRTIEKLDTVFVYMPGVSEQPVSEGSYEKHYRRNNCNKKEYVIYFDENSIINNGHEFYCFTESDKIIIEDDVNTEAPSFLSKLCLKDKDVELKMNNLRELGDIDCKSMKLTLSHSVNLSNLNIENIDSLTEIDLFSVPVDEMPIDFRIPTHLKLILPLGVTNPGEQLENTIDIQMPDEEMITCLMINNMTYCLVNGRLVHMARLIFRFKRDDVSDVFLAKLNEARDFLINKYHLKNKSSL